MKIIKISTELEMTVHEFPCGGYTQENRFLRELIETIAIFLRMLCQIDSIRSCI